MKDKNPHIEELTSKVITQEFTTCSLKAVRLADRINEWHQEKVKELESKIKILKEDSKILKSEIKKLEFLLDRVMPKSDSVSSDSQDATLLGA